MVVSRSTAVMACLMALAALALLPLAQAGTREDPEVRDARNDTSMPVGEAKIPSAGGDVDILAVWLTQDATRLSIHMELAAPVDVTLPMPRPPSVYNVAIRVGGGTRGACSDSGSFAVSSAVLGGARQGLLSLNFRGDGCTSDQVPIQHVVDGRLLAWILPRSAVPGLGGAATLEVVRAYAGPSNAEPLGAQDYADEVPGIPFLLAAPPIHVESPATPPAAQEAYILALQFALAAVATVIAIWAVRPR